MQGSAEHWTHVRELEADHREHIRWWARRSTSRRGVGRTVQGDTGGKGIVVDEDTERARDDCRGLRCVLRVQWMTRPLWYASVLLVKDTGSKRFTLAAGISERNALLHAAWRLLNCPAVVRPVTSMCKRPPCGYMVLRGVLLVEVRWNAVRNNEQGHGQTCRGTGRDLQLRLR